MGNAGRLAILKRTIEKSDMPYKECYLEALDDGIKSIKKNSKLEIVKALIVGTGFAIGFIGLAYITYFLR